MVELLTVRDKHTDIRMYVHTHPYNPCVDGPKETSSLLDGSQYPLTVLHHPFHLQSTEVGVNGQTTTRLGGEET